MRGEFLDLDGHRLYYYAAGTRGMGEPVLFLHGFPTSSYLWGEVAPRLPEGYRLVVLDQLGYGRSDGPAGVDLSVAAHAARARAVLDTLNVPRACIVGHDMGAAVALQLALDAPERVTRLALISAVAFDRWPRWRTRAARTLRGLARHLPASLLAGEAYASLLGGFSDREAGRHALDHFLRPFARLRGGDALLAHLAAQDARDTAGFSLGGITAPTVIVHGARDPFVPASIARRLQAALPNATLEIIPDGRHFVPLDQPDRVASAIGALLAR